MCLQESQKSITRLAHIHTHTCAHPVNHAWMGTYQQNVHSAPLLYDIELFMQAHTLPFIVVVIGLVMHTSSSNTHGCVRVLGWLDMAILAPQLPARFHLVAAIPVCTRSVFVLLYNPFKDSRSPRGIKTCTCTPRHLKAWRLSHTQRKRTLLAIRLLLISGMF